MLKAIDVRFQPMDAQTGASKTVDAAKFEEAHGEIEYRRSTIFNNGSHHITLCKMLEDVNWVTCDLCDKIAEGDGAVHTEEGYTVGECCHDELRTMCYDLQGETFYYVN